jgi:hypothetical protein
VADRAGSVWTEAEIRLADELEKLPKATGTQGLGRPKLGGAKRELPKGTHTLREMGVDRKRASRAKRLKAIPKAKRERFKKELAEEGKGVTPGAILKKNATSSATARWASAFKH